MGCQLTKSSEVRSTEANMLRAIVVKMLKLKRDELARRPPVTFSKILMKARPMNATYKRIKAVHQSLDIDQNGRVSPGTRQRSDRLSMQVVRLGGIAEND